MKSINLEINDGGIIHIWTGTMGNIMVSHEDTKTLRSFPDLDHAINGMFLSGHKLTAKRLNEVAQ
tara:strand:- start:128 stop:322 length:195 start_codon:yes stop_codon:yes gene_type:complete